MTLLSYSTSTSVNGGDGLLAALRTFAVAQGWASEDYQTGKEWASDGDGTYSWAHAGDQNFLDLSSSGYGAQTLRYRFLVDPYDASDDTFYFCPIDPTDVAVDDTSATSPEQQNNWQISDYDRFSLPASSFPQAWFFGNDKFILVVAKVDSTKVISFAFGLPNLHASLQSEDTAFCWPCEYMDQEGGNYSWSVMADNPGYWWNCFGYMPAASGGYVVWWDGAERNRDHYKTNLYIQRTATAGYFNKIDETPCYNGFSNKRTLMKPTILLKDNAAGTWYPAATLPIYYTTFAGCSAGETITYSSEEYLVFPTLLTSYTYGMAIRIT